MHHPVRVISVIAILAGVVTGCGLNGATTNRGSSGILVSLPRDQSAHPIVKNEWWYVVGHLRSGKLRFGYEMTIFKFNHVKAPGLNSPVSIYRTDIAVTDETHRTFHHQITYQFPSSATVSDHPFQMTVGRASLAGSAKSMRLRASLPSASLSLALSSQRKPMYVGGRGYLPFGDGYTYYYSLTDVKTIGMLTLAGTRYRVTGISWLDHQWGNWAWSAIRGWTWMALHLNNGVQLSVFDFRSRNRRVKAASVLLKGDRLKTVRKVNIGASGRWVSPHSGSVYPNSFRVVMPRLKANLVVRPSVADQELLNPGNRLGNYWEGSGTVTGTFQGKRVSGRSYIELTGFSY